MRRAWLVSIDSLQAFRDTRQQERPSPGHYRASIDGTDVAAAMPGNAIRELADRLVEEAAKASEFRVRFELAERAQSTLERELARQTHRREEAERERDELRRRLEGGARETAGPAETVLDLRDGVEGRSQEGSTEPREQAGRPYWWLIASLVLVLAAAVAVIAFFVVWLGLLP